MEALESRIVPSTYTMPLFNQTGLSPSQDSIYVLGFSTASGMELQAQGSSGQFAALPVSNPNQDTSGTISSYSLSNLASITLDSATPLIGARLYFFVVPEGEAAPSLSWSYSGETKAYSVVQPTNPPNSNYPPYDIVEYTQPAGGGLPTIDVQTVDGFIFPLTVTLNNNLGQIGSDLSSSRADVLASYLPFLDAQGAAGTPYKDLVFAPNSIAGQAGGIVNPGQYLAAGANPTSALNTIWDNDLKTLFQTPVRTLSMIGDDSEYYQGTPTQVTNPDGTRSWVLHFVGYSDAAETNPNGNVFNIYSPLTRDPNGPYQSNETSGEMVFANDGVFADSSANVIVKSNPSGTGPGLVPASSTVLGLERDIVSALNRGVALLGPTDGLNGDDSTYWGTETNWYPASQTQNLFSWFMHTATVNGTPIFVQPPGAVTDAQGAKMGSAYGFAFDETPGHGPAGQPNVPSKFDPIPAGTTSMTITLGPWSPPPAPPASPTPPPAKPVSPPSSSSHPSEITPLHLLAVQLEAFCVVAGMVTHHDFMIQVGLTAYWLEVSHLSASGASQLQATFIEYVAADLAFLNNEGFA